MMSIFNKMKERVNNVIDRPSKQVNAENSSQNTEFELLDFLKTKKYKNEISQLKKQIVVLKNDFSDIDKMTALELKQDILEKEKMIQTLENKENELNHNIQNKELEIKNLELQLISTSEDIEMESFSLYRPKYNFATALGYKDKLGEIRQKQKEMIKNKSAVNYFENWTVDGSKAKGRKMTNDNIRQIIRSFNNECEAAINKVKFSNIESIRKRIDNSFKQLNRLNESNKVSLSLSFLNLKHEELNLSFEYERKKQEEKEVLREQREREREEKKLLKEIQSKKKIIDKDIKHYNNMIKELENKINDLEDEKQRNALNKEIADLRANIKNKETEKEELDYREAHSSAGYVYIISNIGSFGENIVKIGVTRRLDPYERISELSSASVPFKYDVHAMVFSYEAYQLESKLHKKFNHKRINRMNMRKEFFNISINEIKEALEKYKDLTIDFTETPEAEEYRESIKIIEPIV